MKNKLIKILILVLILVLAFLIINSTYSKYTNTAKGVIDEVVGNWKVKVNGTDIADGSGKFVIDNFKLDEDIGTHILGEQMAPGTKGRFYIDIDPTGSDVSLKYTLTIDRKEFISKLIEEIGLDPNDETLKERLNFKITNIKVDDMEVNIPEDLNEDIVVSKIKRLDKIKSDDENIRKDLIEVEVEWENNEDNNDMDFLIGNVRDDFKLTLPINVNAIQWNDFLTIADFSQLTRTICDNFESRVGVTYDAIYTGNGEVIEKDANGHIVLDDDNPVLFYETTEDESLNLDEYSINLTIKGDSAQGNAYGNTVLSIGDMQQNSYVSIINICRGYLHIYSYKDDLVANCSSERTDVGFGSYDISEYSNQILNIQVLASKTGNTRVFINGEEKQSFQSGTSTATPIQASIGELKPLRKLKYTGTLYNCSIFNRILNETEIQANWLEAKDNQ